MIGIIRLEWNKLTCELMDQENYRDELMSNATRW